MTQTDDAPARPGRRTKLTPDLSQKIIDVVRAGNYLKTAAQYNGVGQSTLLGWLARGRQAAAAVEAHPEGRLHCPSCDLDRTDEQTYADHADAEAEAAGRPERVALNDCPRCGSHDLPTEWRLDPAEEPYLEFLEGVTQAETNAEVRAVTYWRAAFSHDWRAARDYLARKRPDQWAAKTTVTLTNDEAEARVESAAMELLTALGVDTDAADLSDATDPLEEP